MPKYENVNHKNFGIIVCNETRGCCEYIYEAVRKVDRENKWIREICRRGSRQAADKLVRAYYDEVYAYAYRQTARREDAMDMTQEIMIAALRSLPSFDDRKASFRTWLYRVASHKIIDWRRRQGPETLPLEEVELPAEDRSLEAVGDRLLLRQIERRIASLDPEAQSVFRLRVYGEKTFPEIGEILGIPENTAKSKYHRLIRQLRKEFGDDGTKKAND